MIKLSQKEKMLFVDSYIQNEIDLDIIDSICNKKFRKTILAEFEDFLLLSREEELILWHKNLQKNIPNLIVQDLKERIVETKMGKVLLGIRHLGMDITKPFVNIWTSFPIEFELENIIEIAKKEFRVFEPKFVRFWVKPSSKYARKYIDYAENSFYANKINEIVKKDFPINYENISLEEIQNLNFIDWYKKMYTSFHLEMKHLKFLVTSNSKEDFEQSIKDNLIYFIKFKEKNIGIIAAVKDDFIGENSIYVTEIIIEKKYKGKKLATASQRRFIELNKDKYKYIWGKINIKNIPSKKNAIRVGRKSISTEIILAI